MRTETIYLLWNLNKLIQIANGSTEDDTNTFRQSFNKQLTFRQMYEMIKVHKKYVSNRDIPQSTCLCDICENSVYLVKGINIKLPKDMQLPTNPHDLVETFSCVSSFSDCMNSDYRLFP